MPTAMHLTVLVSLFAVVTVCTDATASSTTRRVTEVTTSATHPTGLTTTKKHDVISSTGETTTNAPQHQSSTHKVTTAVASAKTSPRPSMSPQTPDRTEETHLSRAPETATANHGSTLPPASGSPNVTAATTINTTSRAPSHVLGKHDLVENPGLVAILCIFCIIVGLLLVVATVKCIRSRRSNFERLDEVPMGKVNEESPFARYEK